MKTMLDVFLGDVDRDKAYEILIACPANAVTLLKESSDALKAHCPYWQAEPDCAKCSKHKDAPDCLASVIDAALRECGGE